VLTVEGTVAQVGDVVNLTLAFTPPPPPGVTPLPPVISNSTGTYEGYYVSGNESVFVFLVNPPLPGLGSAIALTQDGARVPTASGPEFLHTGVPDVCFLRGTMIDTPRGELPVEFLSVGDEVSVLEKGRLVFRTVAWVGSQSVFFDGSKADDDSFPVRIRCGAFRPGVPHRDLLVTSEHCVFVDGVLIPVRMLVNERSIVVERGMDAFEYFHVELDQHGILIAEGLETESYLDTGNRDRFRQQLDRDVAPKSWAEDAAAPLTVAREMVEPIWNRLASRAKAMNMPLVAEHVLTMEPELRLATWSGLVITPVSVEGRFHDFIVPVIEDTIWLRSRSARPSETVGRYVDDRRYLGVLVGRINILEGRHRSDYNTHLSVERLSGWHTLEAGTESRWTNGNASLSSLPLSADGRPVRVRIEVLAAGPYRRVVDGPTAFLSSGRHTSARVHKSRVMPI